MITYTSMTQGGLKKDVKRLELSFENMGTGLGLLEVKVRPADYDLMTMT